MMVTFSVFADEIAHSLKDQMDACRGQGIRCIDVRAIDRKNVSEMSLAEARQDAGQLRDGGFTVPCIGSPIGKIRISDDFESHLDLLKHSMDVAEALGTRLVRVFSFYPSKGAAVEDQRAEVMDHIRRMVELAEAAGFTLMHENEQHIYGRNPKGVKDIFATIRSDHLKCIFDPANFISEGVAPYDDAWSQGLDKLTEYFHIKDKTYGAKTCVPAGEGDGQFERIFADLERRGWSGYMTLEPHMAAAGQFSGFTGPQLFVKAAEALKALCERTGIEYN